MKAQGKYQIDFEAKLGCYKIDRLAETIPWRDGFADTGTTWSKVSILRAMVAGFARLAARIDEAERTHAATNSVAAEHYGRIRQLSALCSAIAATPVDQVLRHFVQAPIIPAPGEGCPSDREQVEANRLAADVAEAALLQVRELSERLAVAASLVVREHPIDAPIHVGRKTPLVLAFVEAMVDVWETVTGTTAPRSADGPFQRFCAAAWEDLGLDPNLADKLPRKIAERPDYTDRLPRNPKRSG